MGVIAYQALKNLEASINQSHLPAASTEIVHVQLGDANDALRVVEFHLALVHSHSSTINASGSLQRILRITILVIRLLVRESPGGVQVDIY